MDATIHGVRVKHGRRGDIVALWFAQKHLLLQEKLQWHSLAGGASPHLTPGPPRCTAQGCTPQDAVAGAQPSSPGATTDGGKATARAGQTAAHSALLPQALPVPTGGWAPQLSQSPSTGNVVIRLEECRLEGETVHQQFLKAGQQDISALLRLRVCFLGGKQSFQKHQCFQKCCASGWDTGWAAALLIHTPAKSSSRCLSAH